MRSVISGDISFRAQWGAVVVTEVGGDKVPAFIVGGSCLCLKVDHVNCCFPLPKGGIGVSAVLHPSPHAVLGCRRAWLRSKYQSGDTCVPAIAKS